MAALTDMLELNIQQMLEALQACEQPVSDGTLELRDPHDRKVIGSHYALSHYCAALLLRGGESEVDRAHKLCRYIVATQEKFSHYPDYHYDFNTFIWSLLLTLEQRQQLSLSPQISHQLRNLLLNCGDSRHMTLNWLPMRAWSNLMRAQLTGKRYYQKIADRCLNLVRRGQDRDGLFGDRTAIGLSANPQYHVYTTALLTLGKRLGVWEWEEASLAAAWQWLQGVVLPDGDFNFFGRGSNQIFGWGPWLYLLAAGNVSPGISGDYFSNHLPQTIRQGGLLLDHEGRNQERFWRSYHHASVYQAHLLFWLILAAKLSPEDSELLTTLDGSRPGAFIFGGMRDILQERGPMICALWIPRRGVMFKSPLGHVIDSSAGEREFATLNVVLANYCGFCKEGRRYGFDYQCGAVFPQKLVVQETSAERLILRYEGIPRPSKFFDWRRWGIDIRKSYREYLHFQVPVFQSAGLSEADVNQIFELRSGDRRFPLYYVGTIPGIYRPLDIYSTRVLPRELENITLSIKNS